MGAGADDVDITQRVDSNACISGIYYLRVPEVSRISPTERAGWLEFGRPPMDQYRYTYKPRTLEVQPVEGTLLFFPSHYWHSVIPQTAKEASILMGFKLLPAKN